MPQKVRGVVAHKKGEPVSVETIIVPDPGPGEAARAASWPAGCATPTSTTAKAASTTTSRSSSATRRPGEVEAVGQGVANVAPGDRVIINVAGAVDGTLPLLREAASRGTASPLGTTPPRR